MANNKGGYECEFIEKPPKVFQSECPACLLILREPFQVTCCGYAFCQECIQKIQQDNNPCPCCNSKDFDKFEDKRLKRSLYHFKVRCNSGCGWEGELGELANHLNLNQELKSQLDGCQFANVKCEHCPEVYSRSILYLHLVECPNRPYNCKYCNKFESTYEDVSTNHWPACRHYPVPCTNKCGQTIERQKLDTHIADICPLTTVDCSFKHAGCKATLLRKDMSAHIKENVIEHLSLNAASYKALADRLKEENKHLKKQVAQVTQLKEQVAQLTRDLKLHQICTPVCPVVFMMTNFEKHKFDDDQWISPPFYTHPKGYKMCMVVAANSYGECKGTHTSVGVYLMKGEFDDQLEWPFRGYITIRLLSQEDEEYQETKIPFTGTEPSYDSVASRVLARGRERAETGGAIFNFISHTNLRPKYLKHDCLKLCVYHYMTLPL